MARLIRLALCGVLASGGCGRESDDPQLAAVGAAVAAWRSGEAALRAGEADEAMAHFARAREHRPGDGLLAAWHAEALEAAGDDDAALAALDEAARLAPRLGAARLRRARLRARRGELRGAVADLQRALDLGATTPRRVLADPALAGLRGQPGLEDLPDAPVTTRFEVPREVAFLGSEVEVTLEVERAEADAVRLRGSVRGPVRLVRVIEDESQLVSGDQRARLTWRLRVEGAGEVVVDDLEVRAGGVTKTLSGGRFPAMAPDRAPEVGDRVVALYAPSARIEARVAPSVWREGVDILALVHASDRVRTEPELRSGWRDIIRRDGTDVMALHHLDAAAALEVVVFGEAGVRLRWRDSKPSAD